MTTVDSRTLNLVWQRASLGASEFFAWCERCGRPLQRGFGGYSIHHRRRRQPPFPGVHEPANLLLLCGSGTTGCHGWVHAHPLESRTEGFIVPTWEDPVDTGVLTSRALGWRLLDNEGGEELWTPASSADRA